MHSEQSRSVPSPKDSEQEFVAPIEQGNRQRGKHPGRQTLPAELPRVEWMLACPPEQCVCAHCGEKRAVIGYDESEQLDVEPAKYLYGTPAARSAPASGAKRARLSPHSLYTRSSPRAWSRSASLSTRCSTSMLRTFPCIARARCSNATQASK